MPRSRLTPAVALLLVVAAVGWFAVAGRDDRLSATAFARDDRLSPAAAASVLSGGEVATDGRAAAAADRERDQARARVRATFHRLISTQTAPLAQWAIGRHLDQRVAARTVFYPFGGPDAAFMLALFPWAHDYVLVGLEPVLDAAGHDPLRVDDAQALLRDLPVALTDFSGRGFFVTHTMAAAHAAGRFPGVLAIVLATIGSMGSEARAVEYVCVGDDGAIVPAAPTAAEALGPCGVRVAFRGPSDHDDKSLLYLRLSLSDDSLGRHPGLAALLKRREYVVFCKAAQYFMHGAHGDIFQVVRRLATSGAAILQDDTCVPLRAFDRAEWELAFFGTYEPFSQYAYMIQPKLAAIYADRAAIGDVPQVAGYGRRTNLMLGVRR